MRNLSLRNSSRSSVNLHLNLFLNYPLFLSVKVWKVECANHFVFFFAEKIIDRLMKTNGFTRPPLTLKAKWILFDYAVHIGVRTNTMEEWKLFLLDNDHITTTKKLDSSVCGILSMLYCFQSPMEHPKRIRRQSPVESKSSFQEVQLINPFNNDLLNLKVPTSVEMIEDTVA